MSRRAVTSCFGVTLSGRRLSHGPVVRGAVRVGSDSALPQGSSLKKTEVTGGCLSAPGQDGGRGWGWVKPRDAGWGRHHSSVEAEGLLEPKAGIEGRAVKAGWAQVVLLLILCSF